MEGNKHFSSEAAKTSFPIIAIGASAGGSEAQIAFLSNVPENSGLAFVIIQHLDPAQNGFLADLLQRATTRKVVQVKETTPVQPDCVYIIPPGKLMSIVHRILTLHDYPAPHAPMPIDFFFLSLAEDRQENSIGVILSGTGTDGTLGLKAIKEKGGAVFIQDPSSAKFDSMPRSAIEAGLADVVASAATLPSEIISFLGHKLLLKSVDRDQADKDPDSFNTIMGMLRSQTGHDFSSYKANTINRRIERRMGIHRLDKIADYVLFLQKNPQDLDLLFKEILIGVTSFFREPAEWELLKNKVIPALLAERAPNQPLRAWVSGCATGEEAYSLAIVFKEVLDRLKPAEDFAVQIFATDLDRDAIDKAREGVFPAEGVTEQMSPERLERYFIKVGHGYQVTKPIRDTIIFAQQNMIKDPPFTKIDILLCRNLLIYLTPEIQKRIIPLFHYCLNPGGFLFLGSAETIGNFSNLFEPLDSKSRLFRRLHSLLPVDPADFPSSYPPVQPAMDQPRETFQNIQLLVDKLILKNYAPPTVLVNTNGDILYITGKTGKYLEPAAGKVNWNIFAMAREGLNYELNNLFHKALRQREPVTLNNAVVINEGGRQTVDITVNPLKEPGIMYGMVLIVFADAVTTDMVEISDSTDAENTGPTVSIPAGSERELQLERELIQARQEWKAASTAMQTTHEELKSANEELQSSNEELQSTNEELTTTKEEMQSLNEELKTVNYELQVKVEELSMANNDMKNLLDSTKIATLFLDNELRVKSFTNQMSAVSKLISGDTGRPVTDIASDLFYPALAEDVREVLRTLNTLEKQVPAEDGYWFNVRILPYRTLADKIDGVVITFVDITKSKALEEELLLTKAALEQHISDQDKKLLQAKDRLLDEMQKSRKEAAAGEDPQFNEESR